MNINHGASPRQALLMLAPLLDEHESQLARQFDLVRAFDSHALEAVLADRPERFRAVVTNGVVGCQPQSCAHWSTCH
ncbi:hypothetical protein EGN69_14305 [Pseudomonas monteilii]|nr:hypothetical protein EGN69_14305 [Pseudomonas monteilii]